MIVTAGEFSPFLRLILLSIDTNGFNLFGNSNFISIAAYGLLIILTLSAKGG